MLEVDDTRHAGPRGEQWALTWRGPTPYRVWRVVGSVYLVLVSVLGVVAAGLLFAVAEGPGGWRRLLGSVMCSVAWAFFAWCGWGALGANQEPWRDLFRRLEVDPAARELRVWIDGYLTWQRRRHTLPIAAIRAIHATLRAPPSRYREETAPGLELQLDIERQGAPPLSAVLRARSVARPEHAAELVRRLGRALRMGELREERDAKVGPRLTLLPEGDGSSLRASGAPLAEPTPVPEAFLEPEPPLPRFEPASPHLLGTWRVWAPGQRVTSERPLSLPRLMGQCWGSGVLGLFAGGPLMVALFPDSTSAWPLAGLAAGALLGALLPALVLAWRAPPQGVDLRWAERTLHAHLFGRSRALPFSRIRAVILQGRIVVHSRKGSLGPLPFREEDAPWPPPGALRTLRLHLELDDGGTLPVFHTSVRRETGFVLEAHGLPMAVDLARALGVPWCWRELP
jgi:hypothetical protein